MLRTLIENDTKSSKPTPLGVNKRQPPSPSSLSSNGMISPRSVYYDEADTPFGEFQLNKPTQLPKADVMALCHCKNCNISYYCAYNPESCTQFCNKDCEACYSFHTGKQF